MAKKKEEVEETFISETVIDNTIKENVNGTPKEDKEEMETVIDLLDESLQFKHTLEFEYALNVIESKDWVTIYSEDRDNIQANLELVAKVVKIVKEQTKAKVIHSERLPKTCRIKL